MEAVLSQAGKEEVALALLLLKDFKCDGKFNIEVGISIFRLSEHLGVRVEYEKLMSELPPLKVTLR
jgi:hypothetical protein